MFSLPLFARSLHIPASSSLSLPAYVSLPTTIWLPTIFSGKLTRSFHHAIPTIVPPFQKFRPPSQSSTLLSSIFCRSFPFLLPIHTFLPSVLSLHSFRAVLFFSSLSHMFLPSRFSDFFFIYLPYRRTIVPCISILLFPSSFASFFFFIR